MSDFKNNGVDLDSLFELGDTGAPATGYLNNGQNLADRYQALARDQQIPDIDYENNGTNLSQIFMGNAGQYTLTNNRLNITRTIPWNGNIDARFTVTFSNVTARTNFFTFGGRIKISGSRTGGSSTPKNTDWSNILAAMGTIELGKTATYTGTSQTSTVGSDDLTGTDQVIYNGSNTGSGVYAENDLIVYARSTSSNVVDFRILLRDQDIGDPTVDENVDGTLTFDVDERRHPTQSAPTYTLTNAL
jgi:hypothetical protein